MKVRPFARHGHYTQMDNALLDYLMPVLSANAWKTLCFIMRQTAGKQKDEAQLSYATIKEGTGIASDATLSKTLAELVEGGLIVATTTKKDEAKSYSLDSTLEIEVLSGTTKTEVPSDESTSIIEEHIKNKTTLPNGSVAAHLTEVTISVPLVVVFHQFLDELRGSKNKSALIRTLMVALYGDADLPDFGYIGKTASRVGGWGYLATRLWELSARPPNGDILAYILAEHKGKEGKKFYTNGKSAAGSLEWGAVLDSQVPEYLQEG
jgi:hypothetical protein